MCVFGLQLLCIPVYSGFLNMREAREPKCGKICDILPKYAAHIKQGWKKQVVLAYATKKFAL